MAAAALTALAGLLCVAAPIPAAHAATLTGVAFKDLDRDGVRQASEPVMADQELYLFASDGAYLARATTDVFGTYAFPGLLDATYRVAYASASWSALRQDWVSTTTPAPQRPSRTLAVSGTTTVDFGWRSIVRSTDPAAPISTYTGSSGLRVSSYNDVVPAREIHDALAGARIGAEAEFTEVRFGLYGGSMTSSSASRSNGGPYANFSATSDVSYVSWLDGGDRTLTHEYGHAWSMYRAYILQQDPGLAAYLQARGLAGDPRVNSTYAWQAGEMIAEDYRQLFGSVNARSGGQINTEIPPAKDVPGLAEFLTGAFSTAVPQEEQPPPPPPPPPPSSEEPPPPPAEEPPPPPPAPPVVTSLGITPEPVRVSGTATFSLSAPASVTVRIYNAKGALVRALAAGAARPAGAASYLWDRKDAAGRRAGKGTYRLQVDAVDGAGQQVTAAKSFSVSG